MPGIERAELTQCVEQLLEAVLNETTLRGAAFLSATFSGAERHVRRLGKVAEIEREFMK